jgi:hypothetical protein
MNPIIKSSLGTCLPGVGSAFVKVHAKPFAQLLFSETRRNPEGALSKTGHIAFRLNATEFTSLQSFLGQPADAEHPGSIGHQPDDHTPVLRRDTIHTDMDGKDVEYENLTWLARPQWTEQRFEHTPRSTDVGELTPQHHEALARVIEDEEFRLYSLRGNKPIEKRLLTTEDLRAFLINGQAPRHAPNCVDFAKAVLVAWARLEGPPRAVMRFAASLADCRYPQDVSALAQVHFGADDKGVIQFRPGKGLAAPERLDNQRFHGQFLEASGLSMEVFDRMCADLAAKGLIFGEVFEHEETWGTTFFNGLGKRLRACQPHEGVAAICYHQDTYKGGITHVSLMAFAPDGGASVCHHESIRVSAQDPVSNLMPGIVGVPSNTYDTTDLHQRVLGDKARELTTLPIRHSYDLSGPPMVQFAHLNNWAALREFNDRTAHESYVNARSLAYGTDPDQHLLEKKGAFGRGLTTTVSVPGQRFRHEPLMLPPGETETSSAGAWTNNCAAHTLRCLQAGGCTALPTSREPVGEWRLSEVAEVLLKAGLMPCTDPEVAHIMDDAGYRYDPDEGVVVDAGSFLTLAYHWSMSPVGSPGVYPPDVPRNEVQDKALAEAMQKKRSDRLSKTISDHQASFRKI